MIDGLVSVIMPAYNAEKYIEEAIRSVLAQTYSNWELVIVNDASKDGTEEIIKRYQTLDKRIKFHSLTENKGVANARNVAMQNSIGQYLAFLDSDDLWLPEKLAKQIQFMQAKGYVFTYHAYRTLNEVDKKLGKIISVPTKIDYNEFLKGNNTGSCLSTCIDRNVIKELFMPDENHEDYICWLNIFRKYKVFGYGMSDCLAYYRIGKTSRSSNKLKSAYWTWNVYRKSQGMSLIVSGYYFMHYAFAAVFKRL